MTDESQASGVEVVEEPPESTDGQERGTGSDRQVEPVGNEVRPRLSFPVIGVGASAGGLEAYTEFLRACAVDSGMAFVLIQHLSPRHESVMAELLSRHTTMPVIQVTDSLEVEPNHVYVIRPGHTMTIRDGHLHLGANAAERIHRRPIDDFFRSLAEEQQSKAIGVILSGTGSNGTAGAQVVKAVGGICVAQEPESAKFPAMPRALIDAGLADAILRPDEMFGVIARFAARSERDVTESTPEQVLRSDKQAVNEIVAVLRMRVRHDFGGYKKPTIVRRIQRRMNLLQIDHMPDYVRHLRQNPNEIVALCDDLQIHVTGFFRDSEVWEALRERVIIPLIAEKEDGASVRCWVTACSSGEEAYTLGILLLEAAEAAHKKLDIKIFATDTAKRSLRDARAGLFPGGIESEITPARLDRFFEKEDVHYRVRKDLRELVVFAPQNLLQDPPFSRLDICTCRNLLIYIESEVQRRALSMIHFGLREGGTLLLGTSETVNGGEDMFEAIDKRLRIYRRIGPTRHGALEFPMPILSKRAARKSENAESETEDEVRTLPRVTVQHLAVKALVDEYTPAAVVVDREGEIVYFHGSTERFLAQPRGEPTRDILTLARDEVRASIRTALQRAQAQNMAIRLRDGTLGSGQDRVRIEVTAAPLDARPQNAYYLITFSTFSDPPPAQDGIIDGENRSANLTEELRRVRDELQSTVEELQTSNEEMKASHEEVTSVNEELQSTNEELETSKEELQSLNEELTTVNTQLQAKMEELERTTNDLSSLLSSTDIAVIFLDRQFRIRRYTPAMRDLVDLIPGDTGRPLNDMARKFDDQHLKADAQEVLERLVPIEREIIGHNGRWYMRRLLPYRTVDSRIEGVVITFVDINARRAAETARQAGEERIRGLLEIMRAAVYGVNTDGTIAYYNPRAVELWGREPNPMDALWGMTGGWRLFNSDGVPTDATALPMAGVLQTGEPVVDQEFILERPDNSRINILANITPLFGADKTITGAVNVFQDITDRKRVELTLLLAKESAEVANRVKDDFLATLSHELRTPLSAIMIWSRLLSSQSLDASQTVEGFNVITRSAEAQKHLIDELLDSARIASGKLRLDLRDTDLRKTIADVIESVRPTAAAKGIALRADLGVNLGIVNVDPARIRQIVVNLLSNAVKFSDRGQHIDLKLTTTDGYIVIRIADSGRGINPDFLPHIFERFQQAEGGSTRTAGGLGLGLAIVKQLVDMHNGTIQAESAGAGKGATFTVKLPLRSNKSEPNDSSSVAHLNTEDLSIAPSPLPVLAEVRILLIEDQPETRQAIRLLLEAAHARVTEAIDSTSAQAAFGTTSFDLILSDIGLPGEDGCVLLGRLRAAERAAGRQPIPAIALTAFAHERDAVRITAAGFHHVIAKPFDPALLLEDIERLAPTAR